MGINTGVDGIGYVVCGYLDSEGPGGVTVEGDPWSGQPFESIEEAWAEVDANGGPNENATVIIGVVLPVGIVVPPNADDEYILRRTREAEAAFGGFYLLDDDADEQLALEGANN